MRVLLTGAAGQVGQAVQALRPAEVELRALTRSELDVSDEQAVRHEVRAFAPDLIINAAAYTAVDRAESEPRQAAAVNAEGPGHLARAAQGLRGCRLLHISTDYVFDGSVERPYQPLDTPRPLSVYGHSKLEGERAVLRLLPERTTVLRTAWIYAPRGRNFVLTMLRLMREQGAVRVVTDQRGCPTAAISIAEALWQLATLSQAQGVLHWTDAGVASWYDFALAIAEEARALGLLNGPVTIEPISTAEYPTAARRPAHSMLDSSRTRTLLGLTAVPWQERLRATLRSIAARPAG
jgi:dTDP-4-dehydrorhamnose reductase